MTIDEARDLANRWVAAWNAHDLDLIITHYEDTVELTSPVVAQLLGTSDGKVVGKVSLRAYFQHGLQAYPELHFRLSDVLCGVNSVVLYYINQRARARRSSWSCQQEEKWQELWRTTVLELEESRPLAVDLFCHGPIQKQLLKFPFPSWTVAPPVKRIGRPGYCSRNGSSPSG
jgi:hypothetical protein